MSDIIVKSPQELKATITKYAADGYMTIRDDGTSVILSRKKKFNWVVAIICLFLPIIGWIALVWMIVASFRGSSVVTVSLVEA